MRRPNVVVETVEWDGVTWRRYPNAKQRNRRVYYSAYWRGNLTTLHRAVWEAANGPIPERHEIHHGDGNPSNNDLSNLECLTKGGHRRREAAMGSFSTEKIKKHLAEIRDKASEWHRSDEGRQWHSENSKRAMANRPLLDRTCCVCKAPFQAKHSYAVYCGRACREADRGERPAVHTRTCEWCKQDFTTPAAKQRFCGYACSGKARWAKRRVRAAAG